MRHEAIDEGVGKLCSVLNRISGVALLFLVAILVLNILGRAINHPIIGTYELTQYGFAIVVCTTVAYTAFVDGHIYIDLFFNHYPPIVKAVLNFINPILGIVIFVILGWRLVIDGLEAYKLQEVSSTLGLPTYIFQFALAIGWGLLAIVILNQFVKRFVKRNGVR